MENNESTRIGRHSSPGLNAVLFLIMSLLGFMAIGPGIGMIFASLFFDGPVQDMQSMLMDPLSHPSSRWVLFVVQGFSTAIGMIIVPVLYIKYIDRKPISSLDYHKAKSIALIPILLVGLSVISFMFVNTFFIELNQSIGLPDTIGNIEKWMREKEDWAAELTTFLTSFDSPYQFIMALIVIGVLPAIGEEIVFRGYVQRELGSAFNNPHVGIWVSAFLFSAIHMQFFGLIPRMLLGALFGYMYLWSGRLIYPVMAHFVQNGLQVVLLYLVQREVIDIDLNSNTSLPLHLVIIFAGVTFVLLYNFRKLAIKIDQ